MEKLWLKHYQEGVSHDIDMSRYSSINALFEESAKQHQDKIAYANMGTGLTFRRLDQLSRQFAIYLQQLGLEKGERVAIMMPNLLQYPIALFGILRAGLIVVNTNPLYTPDEVMHQMNDSGAKAIVVAANFAQTVEKALPDMPMLQHVVVTQIGDMFPLIKRSIVNSVVRHVKKMIPDYHLPQAVGFRKALHIGKRGSLKNNPLNHDDIAFLQYTGGTTGIAKGAMLTHGNMVANILQATSWLKPLDLDSEEIIVTALPLYHIFSLTANCLTFLALGAKNILITNPRDITQFIREIKKTGFTAITGVNTLFNALLNHPQFDEIDFSRLKLALAGGMPLKKSVAIKWKEKTNAPILEAYGLTETSPAVTINPLYLQEYNGSIGLPLPSTEISIRDDDGQELPPGDKGELCVKGPQVMPGYWQRPDETSLVFWPDGFLRTGDIATVDENGFVYLIDRKKEMILVSGFNVYPNEVEQVISLMPGILEVGVIGVPENDSGEKVKACIVKRDDNLTEEAIITHCRKHLTPYKVPKIIEFYDDLPKSNVGKILRRALK
ncbi:AMP-binding protein [Legionella londiniensis]|uniref:Long-chain-fatty-acid--CoA ligase n=1 Tax=Legionella londiniensis TaxID=45068 RepID=A0A0W0VMF4_9GAMM|nr:AMP-binding protein [Legionella londiniensis]KTD21303.1 long chain fatty acid-CoA ligase [Legionella londiniensis]STX93329.1 long-chain fatty-acid-CoA ligase [Legionella londiniensis]